MLGTYSEGEMKKRAKNETLTDTKSESFSMGKRLVFILRESDREINKKI